MPATEPDPRTRPEDHQQLLSFFFGGEEYATEILRIREVVEYQRLTPVPTTPDWVRGVMNLRGTVVPVLDLAAKFQYGETPVGKLTCIVIFEIDLDGEVTSIGVMIDEVGRVLELQGEEIQEPPSFGSPVRTDLLVGIAMAGETPIPILDIQKVLTEDELALAVAGAELAAVREREPAPEEPPRPAAEKKKDQTKRSSKKASKETSTPKKKQKGKQKGKGRDKAPNNGRGTSDTGSGA